MVLSSIFPLSGLLCGIFGLATSSTVSNSYFSSHAKITTRAAQACESLAVSFPSITFATSSSTYTNQSTHFFSATCVLSPSCVFLPSDANDIAGALKIIRDAGSPFAVRSGGHMPVPGAADVDEGVLISMSDIHTNTFNEDKSIASIGPGQTWAAVYNWTSPYGLGVAGGRYGQVGVGGLLLGGGINFFGNTRGWSASTVLGYEVVLGNSSIVNVTADCHPDLFLALKGGNNNFGIVTRFDLQTIPITTAWAGITIWSPVTPTILSQVFDALISWVAPGGGIEDVQTTINPSISLNPQTGAWTCLNTVMRPGNIANPPSLANWTAINGSYYNDNSLRSNWASLPIEQTNPDLTGDFPRDLFWSVSLKATKEAIIISNTTFIDAAQRELKNSTVQGANLGYQPISKAWVEAAQAAGPNAIDLDPENGTFLTLLLSFFWTDAADDELVNNFVKSISDEIIEKLKAADLYYPFIYLNDAGAGQNPYELYGAGNSLPRLEQIQLAYDPEGVFKNLAASGFKL